MNEFILCTCRCAFFTPLSDALSVLTEREILRRRKEGKRGGGGAKHYTLTHTNTHTHKLSYVIIRKRIVYNPDMV